MRILTSVGVQNLIISGAGNKPTLPNPLTLTPADAGWIDTDIMRAQWAYNQTDGKWYYRDGNDAIIELASGGGGGSGDMTKAVYDPQNIEADAFALANMTGDTDDVSEGTTNLYNRQPDWNQATNTEPDFIKNKPTIGTVTTKRVQVTATDGATPAIDCASGTEVYVKWEAGTSATAPAFSNVVPDSVLHLSIIKTGAGDVAITFSQSGYVFAFEGEAAAASKVVTLSGDANSFWSVSLNVTAHEISGDKVVTITGKGL